MEILEEKTGTTTVTVSLLLQIMISVLKTTDAFIILFETRCSQHVFDSLRKL